MNQILKTLLVATALWMPCAANAQTDGVIRFGVIADIQYADGDRTGSRYFRNSLQKLDEAIDRMNDGQVRFVVNLGDLTDRDTPHNIGAVTSRLGKSAAPVYNVAGNHDYGNIDDNETLFGLLGMPAAYYAFSMGGWRFIILNTNDISPYSNIEGTRKEAELKEMLHNIREGKRPNGADYNGGVGKKQMRWLERELKRAGRRSMNVLIFSHHPLYGVRGLTALNDLEVIDLLSKYPDTVRGVISGHHHAGAFGVCEGISFITIQGMVETESDNAYGIVTIYPDRIEFEGAGRAESHTIVLNK